MSTSLDVVMVVYQPSRLIVAARFLKRLGRLSDLGKIVVVCNNPAISRETISETFGSIKNATVFVMHHDNEGNEFGGYQVGLDYLKKVGHCSIVVVANDTVDSHQYIGPNFLKKIVSTMESHKSTPCAAGTINHMPRQFVIEGRQSSRWLRSNFVAITQSALTLIEYSFYDRTIERLVLGGDREDLFFSSDINNALQDRLRDTLFNPSSPIAWYAAAKLTADNANLFERKARNILQEKCLSLRLEAADVALYQPSLPLRRALMDSLAKYLHKLLKR